MSGLLAAAASSHQYATSSAASFIGPFFIGCVGCVGCCCCCRCIAVALLLRAAYQPRHLAHAAVLQLSLPHPLDVLRRGEAPRVEANVADHALEMGRRLLPRNRTRLGHHLDARASAGREAGIAEGGRVEGQLRAEGAGREREVRHGSPAAGRRDDEKGGPCGGRETGDRIGERLTIIVVRPRSWGERAESARRASGEAGPFHTRGGGSGARSARCQGQSVFLPSTSRPSARLCDSHTQQPSLSLRCAEVPDRNPALPAGRRQGRVAAAEATASLWADRRRRARPTTGRKHDQCGGRDRAALHGAHAL